MKILSNKDLHCREFGSALFSVADFNEWLQENRLQIATIPDINGYAFVQIEALLCTIERAAGDISNDEAKEIVDADDFLKADRMAELNPRWLVGAEAHRKWRVRLNAAVNAGELVALDFGSKLPVSPADAPILQSQDAPKGITKEQVLTAFEEMVKPFKLAVALKNGKGLFGNNEARTQRGTRGATHPALWNPVILAIGLNEKYSAPMPHLKRAFNEHSFLMVWADEWNNALDFLSE